MNRYRSLSDAVMPDMWSEEAVQRNAHLSMLS